MIKTQVQHIYLLKMANSSVNICIEKLFAYSFIILLHTTTYTIKVIPSTSIQKLLQVSSSRLRKNGPTFRNLSAKLELILNSISIFNGKCVALVKQEYVLLFLHNAAS